MWTIHVPVPHCWMRCRLEQVCSRTRLFLYVHGDWMKGVSKTKVVNDKYHVRHVGVDVCVCVFVSFIYCCLVCGSYVHPLCAASFCHILCSVVDFLHSSPCSGEGSLTVYFKWEPLFVWMVRDDQSYMSSPILMIYRWRERLMCIVDIPWQTSLASWLGRCVRVCVWFHKCTVESFNCEAYDMTEIP